MSRVARRPSGLALRRVPRAERLRGARLVRTVVERAIKTGDVTIAVSALTLLEALVVPLRRGDKGAVNKFREVLRYTPGVDLLAITDPVLEKAAELRAESGLRTPDAIIVATHLLAMCDLFVTNDARLRSLVGSETALLSELA